MITVKIPKSSLHGYGRGGWGKSFVMKYAQSLLYKKGLLTMEKTFLDLYPICSNSIPPNIVPESILSPLRWEKKGQNQS